MESDLDIKRLRELSSSASSEFASYATPERILGLLDKLDALNKAFSRQKKVLAGRSLDTAPQGTLAPSCNGGHWYRSARGWKWNGPKGSGGTFPRPGGDWTGEFILPEHTEPINNKALTAACQAFAQQLSDTTVGAVLAQAATQLECLDKLTHSEEFYRRRVNLLEKYQPKMRDPERTIVCDAIANGMLLETSAGLLDKDRYGFEA